MATQEEDFEGKVTQLGAMFEGVDKEIIESVLRSNQNDVSRACDSLLEITGETPAKTEEEGSGNQSEAKHEETDEEMALRLQMEEDASAAHQQVRAFNNTQEPEGPDFIDSTLESISTQATALKEAATAKWNTMMASFNKSDEN